MKLIVIDGNSLINRAFYGVPLLSNSKGVITNGVYGFMNMLLNLIKQENPDMLAVAFDVAKKNFRHDLYAEYKGTRKGMPEELRMQMPILKDMLSAMNVKMYGLEGFEADDIIGSLVTWAEKKAIESIIVTGDKDSFQLIDDNTKVFMTKKGISLIEVFDKEHLKEVYNLAPWQICHLKALMGDSSDNIPGVPSVGEKTALKLLADYQSLDGVYENVDAFSGKKLGEKLVENKDLAYLSLTLATIERNMPLEFSVEDLKVKEADTKKVIELCKKLELNSLLKNFAQNDESEEKVEIKGVVLEDGEEFKHLLENELVDELTLVLDEKVRGVYLKDTAYILKLSNEEIFSVLKDEQKAFVINTLNGKNLYKEFIKSGVDFNILASLDLIAYLLEPEKDNKIDELMLNYLNIKLDESENYEFNYLYGVDVLCKKMFKLLEEKKLFELYNEIELPLSKVLAQMELVGIKINRDYLSELSVELKGRIEDIAQRVYDGAGEEFNLNSPKQLGVILFEKLGLPVLKKTKTGYSTSAEVLEELSEQNEIVKDILLYRKLAKLKSTYVDGLLEIANREDVVNTSFNQTITATGRLSSTEPNLQNIPVKTEEGRRIRKAFVPINKENILVAADYSQIELRILAHISGDEVLTESFVNNEDIHARTASEVFGVKLDEVTSTLRRNAKAVNFGIVYGQTDYGLSKELGITRKEAKAYIDGYFERYKGVKEWIENITKKVQKDGYVTTMFERRRVIKDINSKNFNLRSFAERTAVNTPIQGSAADIIKMAMIKIDKEIKEKKFKAKMILQVHDELIFETHPSEAKKLIEMVKDVMENVVSLNVPLVVDVKAGFNWAEMEKV